MNQRNETFIFLACREHRTRKKNFFNWLHFFFTWLLLYHKEVTRVFSSTSNIAWQFWMKLATRNFIANSNTHVCKFGRTKIWYSHCPDLFVYTSSGLAFFLMQWVKSTVIFPLRPCFKFSCGQELFQQFLRDLSAKGIHLSIVEINRKYMKLTKFVSDLSA